MNWKEEIEKRIKEIQDFMRGPQITQSQFDQLPEETKAELRRLQASIEAKLKEIAKQKFF